MSAHVVDWGENERKLTDRVSVLVGQDRGAYPSGNSVLVRGASESALIDPSLTVVQQGGAPVMVDAVINSHGHEDHMTGNGLFAESRVHIHSSDLPAAQSLDGLMEVFGFPDNMVAEQRTYFEQ